MNASLKFLAAVAFTALVSGCGDDKKEDPKPTTGTVKGTVAPANSAARIYLLSGSDTIYQKAVTGTAYELTDVKAGTYKIGARAAVGHMAPAPTDVTVTGGQTTDVPVITMTAAPAAGLISLSMGGTAYGGQPAFDASTKTLYITNSQGYNFSVQLPAITKVASYSTTTANSTLEFTVTENAANKSWVAANGTGLGTGTLTVTDLNTTTKKGNANFSFTAKPTAGSSGDKTVTGTLINVRLM